MVLDSTNINKTNSPLSHQIIEYKKGHEIQVCHEQNVGGVRVIKGIPTFWIKDKLRDVSL